MIEPRLVEQMDRWLDENVSQQYKEQPLAQDWARVCKGVEERGEVIEKLISYTGQNPRKPARPEDRDQMLLEMADVAMTFIYGIQHFTKDILMTGEILAIVQNRHMKRISK